MPKLGLAAKTTSKSFHIKVVERVTRYLLVEMVTERVDEQLERYRLVEMVTKGSERGKCQLMACQSCDQGSRARKEGRKGRKYFNVREAKNSLWDRPTRTLFSAIQSFVCST